MKKYLLFVSLLTVFYIQTGSAQVSSPILSEPPVLDRVVSPTVTFRWQDLTGVLSYDIEIAFDPLFLTDVTPLTHVPTSSYTPNSGILSSNATYYWRVRGEYSDGPGPFSVVSSFTTAGTPSQEVDYLKNIINNLENQNTIPESQGNILVNRLDNAENQTNANNDFMALIQLGMFDLRVYILRVSGILDQADAQYLIDYAGKIIQLIYSGNSKIQHQPIVNIVPNTYSLSQNYPNPFNPTTDIEYSIPKNANVTLKVYDMLGKEVATLVNKQQDAGTYITTWNASNFSSGVYFYRLTAGSFVQTKRMSLTK